MNAWTVLIGSFVLASSLVGKPLPENGLSPVNPRFITDPVRNDSDDIKLWVNPENPAKSLLIGTDKNEDGGLHAWTLRGEMVEEMTVRDLARPNNLDILQGVQTPLGAIDIVATTERKRHQIRVFEVPSMKPIDNGGIPVFTNARESEPMGIGLWQRPSDGAVFAVVGGKTGPTRDYLRQYRLSWDAAGVVTAEEVRQFGNFSGLKEIEAVVIDREHGFVYYSDEGFGIRKYHADPDHPEAARELALIRTENFAGDVEGLSIYDAGHGTGYLMASDQQANRMHFYRREGAPGNPHHHEWIHSVVISAHSSDGNTLTSLDLGPHFPSGLMAAMSEGRTFHLYNWDVLAGSTLRVAPDARPAVEWIWTGAVTPHSARINAKVGHLEEVFLLVSQEDDFSPALRMEPSRTIAVNDGWIVQFEVSDLEPSSRYHTIIERKGRVLWKHAGSFVTFPQGPADLRLATGSCANTGSNHPVFETIRLVQPDFFLHLGDLHYEDIAIDEAGIFHSAYDRVMKAPRQAELYRSVPVAYIWDDHDYGPNNSDKTSPSRTAALQAYREAVPHYPLETGRTGAIYQAFSFGRIRFILTDTRSERSPRSVPDDGGRTMLGNPQKEWLKRELLNSSRSHALVVWVNGVPWIGDDPHYDRWSGFSHERQELAAFIEENDIKNLCMLSGDAHMLAIDDGTNNTYGPSGEPLFPILQAAAFDRRGSVKGGPYSHGAVPGPGQFGLLEVRDAGGSSIAVTLQGLNHEGEVLMEHAFEVEMER